MYSSDETDVSTGAYHCDGSVTDLKILVQLEQIVPWLSESIQRDKNIHGQPINETKIFSWQERIFSNKEQKETRNENIVQSVLYSYTSKDREMITKLQENNYSNGLIRKKVNSNLTRRVQHMVKLPSKNLITYKHFTEENTIQQNEYMYIVTDLHELFHINTGESSEYVLLQLIYNKELRLLTVYPDLTGEKATGNPGQIVKSPGATRAQYLYWVSIFQDPVVVHKLKVYKSLDFHHLPKFDLPQKGSIDVHIFASIVACEGFSSDFQVCHYMFKLPKGWTCNSNSSLSGTTQTSANTSGKATFQHIMEITLSLKITNIQNRLEEGQKHERNEVLWPELVLQVLSKNMWGCISIDGYTGLIIPSKSGHYKYLLNAYRPTLNNVNSLRQFFIGTSPQIDDMTFNDILFPKNSDESIHGKFGFQTSLSGNVRLELNIIQRHQANIYAKKNILLDDHSSMLTYSINSVLDLFRNAHRKLCIILQE